MACAILPPDLDFVRTPEEATTWLKAVPSHKGAFAHDELLECFNVKNAWGGGAEPLVLKGPYKDGSYLAKFEDADKVHFILTFMRVPDTPPCSSLQPPVKRKLTLYKVSVKPDSKRAAFPSKEEELEEPEADEEPSQSPQSEGSGLSVSGASLDSETGEAGEANWAKLLWHEGRKAALANPVAAPNPEFNMWIVSHVPPLYWRAKLTSVCSRECRHVPVCEKAVAAVKRISLVKGTEEKDEKFKQTLWKALGLNEIRKEPTAKIADIADAVIDLKDTSRDLLLCPQNWGTNPDLPVMSNQYWLHEVDARIEHPLSIPSFYKVANAGTLVEVTQSAPGAQKQLRGAVIVSEELQQAYPAGLLEFTTKKGDQDSSGIDFKVYQMIQNLFAHRQWFKDHTLPIRGTIIFNGDDEPERDFGKSFGADLHRKRQQNPFLDCAAAWYLEMGGKIHFRWHKKKLSAAESHLVNEAKDEMIAQVEQANLKLLAELAELKAQLAKEKATIPRGS